MGKKSVHSVRRSTNRRRRSRSSRKSRRGGKGDTYEMREVITDLTNQIFQILKNKFTTLTIKTSGHVLRMNQAESFVVRTILSTDLSPSDDYITDSINNKLTEKGKSVNFNNEFIGIKKQNILILLVKVIHTVFKEVPLLNVSYNEIENKCSIIESDGVQHIIH